MNNLSFQLVDELTHDDMVSISDCVQHHFNVYFAALDGAEGAAPHDLHNMMLTACEKPLLELVMQKTRGNQSLASEWLGLNRATLRKKLVQYDLL
jgi:Fis family transcriptional regulator, factor for inversion stimulation protein